MDSLIPLPPRARHMTAARQTETTYRHLLHKLGRGYDGMTDATLRELAGDLLAFVSVRRAWLDRRPRPAAVDARDLPDPSPGDTD